MRQLALSSRDLSWHLPFPGDDCPTPIRLLDFGAATLALTAEDGDLREFFKTGFHFASSGIARVLQTSTSTALCGRPAATCASACCRRRPGHPGAAVWRRQPASAGGVLAVGCARWAFLLPLTACSLGGFLPTAMVSRYCSDRPATPAQCSAIRVRPAVSAVQPPVCRLISLHAGARRVHSDIIPWAGWYGALHLLRRTWMASTRSTRSTTPSPSLFYHRHAEQAWYEGCPTLPLRNTPGIRSFGVGAPRTSRWLWPLAGSDGVFLSNRQRW